MLVLTLPAPTDHPRPGAVRPVKAGRAARERVGTFNSVARRGRGPHSTFWATREVLVRYLLVARADRHNDELAGRGYLTAAHYLREVVRAPEEFIAKYASAFGRKAAEAYRKVFGMEPTWYGLTVIGNRPRFSPIAAYSRWARVALDIATGTHKKTAALIGA